MSSTNITLTVDNSYSAVSGLTISLTRELKKRLSYKVSAGAYGRFQATRYLIDRKGMFPSGLLMEVQQFLAQSGLRYNVVDLRQRPPIQVPQDVEAKLWPHQRLAVEAAVKSGRGTISMATGTGKTLVYALIASRLNVRTLVVVPTLELKQQALESLQSVLTDTSMIRVENIDSRALKRIKDIDCLIIDEAHHSAAKTYQTLNKTVWNSAYYRFFLTATPFRTNQEENLLFKGIAGEVVFSYSYQDAVRDGIVVPVEAYYIDLPKVRIGSRATYREVYSTLVVNNQERHNLTAKLLKTLDLAGKSVLCLVREVSHGYAIADPTDAAFVRGEEPASRIYIQDFCERGINVLVGTTGILGEGVDTKPAEYVVIAGLGRSKSAFMQQVGRAVRKYPGKVSAKIIIFRDKSHRYTLTHFKEQVRILETEYGATVAPLEL